VVGSGSSRLGKADEARLGVVGHGPIRQGRRDMVGQRKTWFGKADTDGQGGAGSGEARSGEARQTS
jgi:hypothetical protein